MRELDNSIYTYEPDETSILAGFIAKKYLHSNF